jgi:ABC-type transport system involved in cytochrome c biogenesis permease subunit
MKKRLNLLLVFLIALGIGLPMAQVQGLVPMDKPPAQFVDTIPFDSVKGPSPLPDDISLLPLGDGKSVVPVKNLNALARTAILHEGRLKPFETFARHTLLQLLGKQTFEGKSAVEVVATLIFAPENTVEWKLFLINNPEIAQGMGIPEEKHRRYSLKALQKGLHKLQKLADKANQMEEASRSLTDKEFLRVWSNVFFLVQLGHTFDFALPSPTFTLRAPESKSLIGLPTDREQFSFWELMSHAPALAHVLETVGNRAPDERTLVETEVIAISQAMFLTSQTTQSSAMECIPPLSDEGKDWLSPPESISDPARMQKDHALLDAWVSTMLAYRNGDQAKFDASLAQIQDKNQERAHTDLDKASFDLEVFYQKLDPHFIALVLYWFVLIGCFVFFMVRKKWLYYAILSLMLAGISVHVAGIVLRILIMSRPPVTSLYETFPFVAAVAILASLVLERFNRQAMGLLAAALLGVILLSIANRYAAEGDTMRMLVAVLNSNFWLSTHVICITIGYSACLLSGAIGHMWLVRALLPGGEDKPKRLREIQKMIYGTLGFGLLFSFIGTVLGGIWADQSWGRFWGWDPKENGALLIVVWCVILLHARWWGKIRDLGMALGAVFGSIVVSLAWVGVNLLNVGLHSYGFTSGTANKLMAYIAAEILFMVITGAWIKSRQLSTKSIG